MCAGEKGAAGEGPPNSDMREQRQLQLVRYSGAPKGIYASPIQEQTGPPLAGLLLQLLQGMPLPAMLYVLTASSPCARASLGTPDARLSQRMCPPVTLLFPVFQRDTGAAVPPGTPALTPCLGLPIPAFSRHTALTSQPRSLRAQNRAAPP